LDVLCQQVSYMLLQKFAQYGTLYSVDPGTGDPRTQDPGTRDPGTQTGMHRACTYGSLEPRWVPRPTRVPCVGLCL